MARNPIIQVKDLVAGYGEEVILNRISFDVYEGEIFAVLGGSGSGKSTLLKHLIGLLQPRSGQVLIDGDDITRCDDKAFQKILRKIGVLYQSAALFGSMTLAENVALPILEYTDLAKNSVASLVNMKLRLVQLDGYENHLPSEISGGMKKRAGLARALALSPEILFLDEPTAGLDPIKSAEIDELILQINKEFGTTVVVVTHELASIFNIADRVVMIDKGRKGVIAEGDPFMLKNQSSDVFVRRFFVRNETKTKVLADSSTTSSEP